MSIFRAFQRHAKGGANTFYIINALGQNLANSESCPIPRRALNRMEHLHSSSMI